MPSIRRHRRRHYVRQGIVALVVAAIGVGLYFGLSSDYWKQLVARVYPIADPTPEVKSDPPLAAENEFEAFLSKSNVQQLILKSTELADDSHDDLLTRLNRQQQKILIADELLNQRGNDRAKTFGIASKLKAMRTRELIDFDHGLTNEANLNELSRLALLHASTDDENTIRQAMLGRLLAKLIQSSLFDDTDRPDSIQSALGEFQSVAEQNLRDQEVALELFGYLQRIHLKVKPDVFQQFADAFETAFGRSEREQLRKLADNVAASISESEFDFVDVLGAPRAQQKNVVDQLASQLREALERSSISQQGHVAIGREIRNLAAVGQYDIALELADSLQRRMAANDVLQPLVLRLQQDRKHYRLVGSEFSLEGIMTLANQPFAVRHASAPVKGLLFITAETMLTAQQSVSFIMNIAGKYVAEGKFCLSLIYIDNGDNDAALAAFKRTAGLVPVIDFGRIDSSSEPGKEIIERLAVISLPMLMLLDADNRVRGIDVNPIDFERRVRDMLKRN